MKLAIVGRLLLGLSGAVIAARPALADSGSAVVAVQVSMVRVSAQRPGNAGSWDGASAKDDGMCGFIKAGGAAAGAYFAGGMGATVGSALGGFLCAPTPQQQRDPRAPDLVLRLDAGGDATYYSYIVPDSYSHDFSYTFLVPLEGIPAVGFTLAVLDQDGKTLAEGELIGSMRISRAKIEQVLHSRSPIVELHDGGVTKLELIVRPVPPSVRRGNTSVDVATGVQKTGVKVRAGELISISARGKYNVTSWPSAAEVGPRGFSGGSNRSHNLDGLDRFPHAGAVAVVAGIAVYVGDCGKFVAPQSGELSVGVNDDDIDNNEGKLVFNWSIALPSTEAWVEPAKQLPCTQAASNTIIGCRRVAARTVQLFNASQHGSALRRAQKNLKQATANSMRSCKRHKPSQRVRRCILSAKKYSEIRKCK